MVTKTDTDRAERQAKSKLESIIKMVGELKKAGEEGDDKKLEEAMQAIQEDPLSVEVRSNWHVPGSKDVEAGQYNILLCTGGPAVRIIGNLDEHSEPESAMIEYQDWFTPWIEYRIDVEEEEKVMQYARQFYFAEA